MPSNILLLGAGFSRNWGGWLASELRNRIGLRLEDNPQLSALLNGHNNFEDALQALQNEFARSPNANNVAPKLQEFQRAIAETFDVMNGAMARCQFEFCNDMKYSVASYLTRFDAIFTLNQDLLLERHYLTPHIILSRSNAKVSGGEIPGVRPEPSQHFHGEDQPLYTRWYQKEPFGCSAGFQPYFKLHGSTNWFSPSGEQLMVMGGDKSNTITRHPVLAWYAEKFEEYLSAFGARLTVIGYGFRDRHVNDTICYAWKKSKFPMMIVGPDGREILKKVNPSYGGAIPGPPGPLEGITSFDSTRPLSSTFGGNDPAEHDNLIAFLKLR
jgi:hypothetical protein